MPIQPYPTYQPWQGQYTTQFPTYQAPQMVQPYQHPWNSVKVDGADEAMNRFLMHYPASMLVPGFVSDPLFDINGRQFHALSIEQDGRRNLETFDYKPHVEEQPVVINDSQWVSVEDFEDFVNKTEIALEELRNRGVHGSVQSAGEQHSSAADAAGAASLPRHVAGR